ncbi:MAG: NAD-dependent epimerase/dehydratase family protein [Spirochaetales bacterium]
MSSIALTGSEGYIGRALERELQRSEPSTAIIGIDRTPSEGDPAGVHALDLSSVAVDELCKRIGGVQTVFHLAAARTDWGLTYEGYYRDNVRATRTLIEACKASGVSRIVYTGTVGVYGPSHAPIDESAPFNATTHYGLTKAQAERELIEAAQEHRWSLRILRPSAVFSEYAPPNTNIYRLVEAIRRRRFVMIGDGSEVKTTSYLHNVVDAILWLYRDLDSGGIAAFNYVDEPRLTTREMVGVIRGELGRRGPALRLPLGLVDAPARLLDVVGNAIGKDFPITSARIRKFCTSTNFDSSAIRAAGFTPRYSSVDALKRTVAWHRDGRPA